MYEYTGMTICGHRNDEGRSCTKPEGHKGDHGYILPLDIRMMTGDTVEVKIRHDGQVIWVNTEDGCVCRISGIKELILEDEREKDGKITATKPDPSVRITLEKKPRKDERRA